jgi:large subunit ribosomal protein L21
MYAVIKTGGKQLKVSKDDIVEVEKLAAAEGDSIEFDSVLLVSDGTATTTGTPHVDGAMVTGEVVKQKRAPTIIVFKKQRRQNHRRKNGHRQSLTAVRITDILTDGKKPAKKTAKAPAKAGDEKTATKEKAAKPAEKKPAKKAAAKPAAKKASTTKPATTKPATTKSATAKPASDKSASDKPASGDAKE